MTQLEKKALKEALSNYNNLVVHCDSRNGYVPVEKESVLSGNVAWDSSEGLSTFQNTLHTIFWGGVAECFLINPIYFFIYLFV